MAVPRTDSSPPSQGTAHHPPRVVVAEDDPEMRSLLVDALRRDGYEIVDVNSGLALFDELRAARQLGDPPSLIVSDIRMPGPSGLSILREIRGWGWEVPAIVITGYADRTVDDAADNAGAACLFHKPLDLDDLRTAVMHFLSRRRPSPQGVGAASAG